MIHAVKDMLTEVITTHTGIEEANIVRDATEEKSMKMKKEMPFISLMTDRGAFDNRFRKHLQYVNKTTNQLEQRYVRGRRELPIIIRVYAKTEAESDSLLTSFYPYIPEEWEYDQITEKVNIEMEGHSDNSSRVSGYHISAVMVRFYMQVGTTPEPVPVINTSSVEEQF